MVWSTNSAVTVEYNGIQCHRTHKSCLLTRAKLAGTLCMSPTSLVIGLKGNSSLPKIDLEICCTPFDAAATL